MPARILEAGVVSIVLLGMIFFLQAASVAKAPLVKEAIAVNEQVAKQTLLALEKYKSTSPKYKERTVIEIIHLGYLTNREEFFDQAEADIEYYLPKVLDAEWRVYTKDGRLDVSSEGFETTRNRGSAKTVILESTELIVVIGF
jgi:hypothetical protein